MTIAICGTQNTEKLYWIPGFFHVNKLKILRRTPLEVHRWECVVIAEKTIFGNHLALHTFTHAKGDEKWRKCVCHGIAFGVKTIVLEWFTQFFFSIWCKRPKNSFSSIRWTNEIFLWRPYVFNCKNIKFFQTFFEKKKSKQRFCLNLSVVRKDDTLFTFNVPFSCRNWSVKIL